MPLSSLRPDLAARVVSRLPHTRSVICRRCHASPEQPCIIQSGAHAGSEWDLHHIERIADANPDIVDVAPDPADAPEAPVRQCQVCVAPQQQSCDGCAILALRSSLSEVTLPSDVPALSNFVPPQYAEHFTEAAMAIAARVRSVYCPECEAAPGQPCVGRKAFKGRTMRRHHGARAAAVYPALFPLSDGDRLEAI
jgi:hypothetical protein